MINKVSFGFGKKSDFLQTKFSAFNPAPNQYNSHIKNSISYISSSRIPAK
jgi:hypothetical protein